MSPLHRRGRKRVRDAGTLDREAHRARGVEGVVVAVQRVVGRQLQYQRRRERQGNALRAGHEAGELVDV
jgi:hypothetical protein